MDLWGLIIMRKNKIIYSLSTRGLYSELFNLCLAMVYARQKNLHIELNTYLWNSRFKSGWIDYFESTIESSNNSFSAQDKVYTNEKPWIGKVYYKPKEFFTFYYRSFLNQIYKIVHPRHLLTKDIFKEMRSSDFIYNALGDNAFNLMESSFKQIYILNPKTKDLIKQRIRELEIPDDYIGVHIRRGDKITSKEMNYIHNQKYVKAIVDHKMLSNNIYIATDDTGVINSLKTELESLGFIVYYNLQNDSKGFDEAVFNQTAKQHRYKETINVLLDMEILTHSKFFIGTYTSNLSRVVPFYLGIDHCISLDNEWNIINSINGL